MRVHGEVWTWGAGRRGGGPGLSVVGGRGAIGPERGRVRKVGPTHGRRTLPRVPRDVRRQAPARGDGAGRRVAGAPGLVRGGLQGQGAGRLGAGAAMPAHALGGEQLPFPGFAPGSGGARPAGTTKGPTAPQLCKTPSDGPIADPSPPSTPSNKQSRTVPLPPTVLFDVPGP